MLMVPCGSLVNNCGVCLFVCLFFPVQTALSSMLSVLPLLALVNFEVTYPCPTQGGRSNGTKIHELFEAREMTRSDRSGDRNCQVQLETDKSWQRLDC